MVDNLILNANHKFMRFYVENETMSNISVLLSTDLKIGSVPSTIINRETNASIGLKINWRAD